KSTPLVPSHANICRPDRGANQSNPSIAVARRGLDRFTVFSLGTTSAITDNSTSKAASSGHK
ncbi:MAG: hypothetical protein KGJ00_23785, partial [Bradyrhizobium sp.]|nr:hypothetical protein [Bradyrhizobium sp.]